MFPHGRIPSEDLIGMKLIKHRKFNSRSRFHHFTRLLSVHIEAWVGRWTNIIHAPHFIILFIPNGLTGPFFGPGVFQKLHVRKTWYKWQKKLWPKMALYQTIRVKIMMYAVLQY